MITSTTIREVSTPSGSVFTVEQASPSFLSRLAALTVMALVAAAGVLIIVPVIVLGLALLVSFAVYLFLYRAFSRLGRGGNQGRQNVRVVVRDPDSQ